MGPSFRRTLINTSKQALLKYYKVTVLPTLLSRSEYLGYNVSCITNNDEVEKPH